MKPSGKHKHNKQNELGEHTHQYEDLDEEGLKLIVKGKLKNLPNFTFKKPKTEKQKKEEKKKNKKQQLNELIDIIENNFSKFQSKKQIAQQSSGSSIPIPIYIPQYTQPTGQNLNVETLTEINDMILKKENELKQYYEKEYKKSFAEVDKQYSQTETQTETDVEYETKLKELNDYYNQLIKFRDDLQKERNELSKKSNISQQETDEYNRKLKELDDIYNKLLRDEAKLKRERDELKRERDELSNLRYEEEIKAIGPILTTQPVVPPTVPTVPPLDLDLLELFGTPREEEPETFETPRGEIQLTRPQLTPSTGQSEFQPLALPLPLPMPSIQQLIPSTGETQFIPAETQPPPLPLSEPRLSEGFELVEFEEPNQPDRPLLLQRQEQQQEPARNTTQDIVDLLDILDDTVINRFKQSEPYLQLEDRANTAERERDEARIGIEDLKNTMEIIENNLLELGEEQNEMREADKAVIEEELKLKVKQAEDAQTENDRKLALKEAEILENKLQGAIESKELRDELEKLKKATEKELESKEQQIQQLEETQQNMLLSGTRGEGIPQLQSKADIPFSGEYQYLRDLNIPDKFIPKRPQQFKKLYNEILQLQNDEPETFRDIIETANNSNASTMGDYFGKLQSRKIVKQKKFTEIPEFNITEEERIQLEKKKLQEKIKEEEEREARNEKVMGYLIETEGKIEEQTKKIKNSEDKFNQKAQELKNIRDDITEIDNELRDFIARLEQYDNIFETAGIKTETDIEQQGEPERQQLRQIFNESIELKKIVNEIQQMRKEFLPKFKEAEKNKIEAEKELLRDKSDKDELLVFYERQQDILNAK